ncbi:MAG TPA: hypothetical protein VN018_07730 [Brevundimonas sp.]|nr:hypothetical protein [Brevundimonas sp.]
MTAEIIALPVRRPPVEPAERPCLSRGDIVVACVNATLKVWCAWPVAVVDDDGVVIGVHSSSGKLLGIDRLNCDPTVYGFRAADHQPEAFAALRWKTWRDPGAALFEFARIGKGGA